MPNVWLENSDYVSRFRYLENNNVQSDARVASTPPSNVIERLSSASLQWADLTTLAKQAILWDMGYVKFSEDSDELIQLYTSCTESGDGASMATIAVPESSYLASQTNATLNVCKGADGNYTRQQNSHGLYLGKVVKCAVPLLPEKTTPNSFASMWAQDGLGKKDVPDARFWRHEWHSDGFPSFLMFAIQTVPPNQEETAWNMCPPQTHPGSLIIPCTVYMPPTNMTFEIASPNNVKWCVPQHTSVMTKWLSDIKNIKSSKDQLSTTTVAIIAACAVLLVLGICFVFFCWRKYRKVEQTDDNVNYFRMMNQRRTTNIHTASEALNAFQEDPNLCSKRLPYASVHCIKVISKGTFGEVWLGTLHENSEFSSSHSLRKVAVKKLLASKQSDTDELECFADEIRLMALFSHPNIVTFIGFAWNTLQNMSCITEYLANGDLSSYLATRRNLEWKIKIRLAHGILKAILYLHQLTPQVIHRDLKGKNVLVSDNISAKLSDFGISRQRILDETMTMGVGTAFWAAPEVLLGLKYDSSVDIYSFGCIMSELDTHNIPYSDMMAVPSIKLVQMITGQDGGVAPLRPRFTHDSPEWFREISSACLNASPSLRPRIADLELRFAQELAKHD